VTSALNKFQQTKYFAKKQLELTPAKLSWVQ